MWFSISILQGLCLYLQFQMIQGEIKCRNEYWLQTTQSSKVPPGHTHEIPEASDMTVVFAYEVTCPLCVFTMTLIISEGGMFSDVTHTGVDGILDHIAKWKERRDEKLRERELEWERLNPTTTTTTTTTPAPSPSSGSKMNLVPCGDPNCKTCPKGGGSGAGFGGSAAGIVLGGLASGLLMGGIASGLSGSSSSFSYKNGQRLALSSSRGGWGGSSWKSSGSSWKSGGFGGGLSFGKGFKKRK